jgi:hypothetical protein
MIAIGILTVNLKPIFVDFTHILESVLAAPRLLPALGTRRRRCAPPEKVLGILTSWYSLTRHYSLLTSSYSWTRTLSLMINGATLPWYWISAFRAFHDDPFACFLGATSSSTGTGNGKQAGGRAILRGPKKTTLVKKVNRDDSQQSTKD